MKLTTEQRSEIISEMASSEAGFNELMRVLLDCFSKQERALFLEEHKGEQGNGFCPRRWRGHGCSFQLRIPRTRSGAFQPIILGILAAQESERALLFHELYARGLSCEDIAEVGCRIYGHHYSKQQVSRLSGACYEEIQEWLARRLSPHYLAVYIDATFCSTRRDGNVSKEAYYTMLGLLPDGNREVLTVVNHPTEGAIAWEMELEVLKERGVEQIDLIVSDALRGIENAVCSAFPTTLHQLCVVHFKLLLSAKLQNDTISLSATPINRRCGFLFRKVSPLSQRVKVRRVDYRVYPRPSTNLFRDARRNCSSQCST